MLAVSVLFASKFPSSLHSFAIVSYTFLLFGLFPLIRNRIRMRYSKRESIMLTISLVVLSGYFLLRISYSWWLLYTLVSIVISLVIPCSLMSAQKYKKKIKGPWDCAEIKLFTTTQVIKKN
jgi:phosphatidylinositol N-acetylglucosaminyltransferase subunit C